MSIRSRGASSGRAFVWRSPRSTRRQLLQAFGLAGGGLSLPNILRLRSASAATTPQSGETSLIFIQLGGGASHFETYDPKPAAPAEYRGVMNAIATNVAGIQICGLLPRQAQLMDRLSIVRSVTHHEASHIALHAVETGYFLRSAGNALKGEMPSVGSVVSRVRGVLSAGLPSYVSLPQPFAYSGAHYLGARHNGFSVNEDPSAAEFQIRNLALLPNLPLARLEDRQALRRRLDRTRAAADLNGTADALDAFSRQALELMTGEKARAAFDIAREPAQMRDRYGRHAFGQRLMLARRLVEAGVPLVLVRTFDWDDHQKLAEQMIKRCGPFDAALATLIEDLQERGLSRNVLIIAMGEFGRTPRINANGGRDHWPAVSSVLIAGGRYKMGQAIGASDSKGAGVSEAPYRPQHVLGMAYRHLGIDPGLTFRDFTGRPRYVLEEREPIRELES